MNHWFVLFLLTATMVLPHPGSAQSPAQNQQTSEGPMLRFTPEMARGLARQYVRNMLVRRYELDPSKVEEATEITARRFMAMAHQLDGRGAELIEYMAGQMVAMQTEGREQDGLTPALGKGIGDRLLPFVPALRDLVRDVSSDVRPMLSFKQQLKLTGDVAMAATAINAFEENMQRWSKGGAQPYDNPFEQQRVAVQKEEDGLSRQAKNAEKSARGNVEAGEWRLWKSYVEDAKKLYELDASQAATAESLLREYTARAETLAADATWRDQMYRNRLWWWMLMNMRQGWGHLLWHRLEAQQQMWNEPIRQLAVDFKTRIDQIPTAAQRNAADRRIEALLAEKGLTSTEASP
jgi:hypothetical protein